MPLLINDSTYDIDEIIQETKRLTTFLQENNLPGLGLIVIDPVVLVEISQRDSDAAESRLNHVLTNLKRLAVECDVPILALSIMNQSVDHREDHLPQLHDFYQYKSIRRHADVIAFLYRNDYYRYFDERKEESLGSRETFEARVTLEKKLAEESTSATVFGVLRNSHGPIGWAELHYDRDSASFIEQEFVNEQT